MIRVTEDIQIPESELRFEFIRASGPGGQKVNKTATAAQLRFDVRHSPWLPEDVRQRLMRLARKRISEEGILVITARRFRSQERNRDDAIDRLIHLIRSAAQRPKPRRKTRPPAAAKERRLRDKRHRSRIKQLRRQEPVSEE